MRVVHGRNDAGQPAAVRQLPASEAVANPAFDVTRANLVTAIIAERGSTPASTDGLLSLYPEERRG